MKAISVKPLINETKPSSLERNTQGLSSLQNTLPEGCPSAEAHLKIFAGI